MFFFGHLGITSGLFYALERKIKFRIDYRYVLVGAIISDIIDKPLSLLLTGNPFTYGKSIGHSLLFVAVLFSLNVFNKKSIFLGLGAVIHLILDSSWAFSQSLFWPMSNNLNTFHFENTTQWTASIFQPYNLGGEVVGGLVIAYIAWRHKLYRKNNLQRFLKTGYL